MEKQIGKEGWIALACSPNLVDRELAFQLAPHIKEEIQDELLFWLEIAEDMPFGLRREIYALLTPEYQKQIETQQGADLALPNAFNWAKMKEFLPYYQVSEDPMVKKVVVELSGDGRSPRGSFLPFIRKYRSRTGASLSTLKVLGSDLESDVQRAAREPKKAEAISNEKQNWISLAASQNSDNRYLALALAERIKTEIQLELAFWLFQTRTFQSKLAIFNLLDPTHQELVDGMPTDPKYRKGLLPQLDWNDVYFFGSY